MSALADRGVLVTRPRAQAGELTTALVAQGARVLAFPALEIRDPANDAPLNKALDRLAAADIAVFISVNAVQRVFNRLGSLGLSWPTNLSIAAIGARTAKELRDLGHPATIVPPRRFDSEALLALPELAPDAVFGRRVLVFRGDGGREHLADELTRRGAEVSAIESYRRAKPDADASDLMRAWSRNEIDIVLVGSVETWHNLYEMVGKLGRMWLRKTAIVAGSERIAEAIRSSGHAGMLVVAEDPSDTAMIATAARALAPTDDA
ncbi:MAG: uroporphyrinogen-III synthase [Thioalkalivibrionaceae bacterium]